MLMLPSLVKNVLVNLLGIIELITLLAWFELQHEVIVLTHIISSDLADFLDIRVPQHAVLLFLVNIRLRH